MTSIVPFARQLKSQLHTSLAAVEPIKTEKVERSPSDWIQSSVMSRRHLLSANVSFGWLAAALVPALLVGTSTAHGGFVVSSWFLASQVEDLSVGQNQHQYFFDVQTPLALTLSAEIPTALAISDYEFAWSGSEGSFNSSAVHVATDVQASGAYATSGGQLHISATQDMLVSATGFYNYALPPDEFFSRLEANITRQIPYELFWGDDPTADSFGGNFVSGTLHVDTPPGGVFLPAGDTYVLSYTMLLFTLGGGTNAIGAGNGGIHWTLQVVPECTTVPLLLPALAFVTRRKRGSTRRLSRAARIS